MKLKTTMVCGVFQQIKSIHHSSFLYENSDFPTFYPATFSSRVYHQGSYRFGSPVLSSNVRRTLDYIGDALANIRQTITSQFFFIGTAGIYAHNRKASGSIACIIIHFTIADAKIPNRTEAQLWKGQGW